jgi:predicted O-methyltransferase YrrM
MPKNDECSTPATRERSSQFTKSNLIEKAKWVLGPVNLVEKAKWHAFLNRHSLPRSIKTTGASLHSTDLEAVMNIVRDYRVKEHARVVELGSGVSTVVLALLLPQISRGIEIVSVEGEKKYAEQTQEAIKRYRLHDTVRLFHIPYAKYGDASWFNKQELTQILEDTRVDILLVDAPPRKSCPRARQPAIPFFLPYLKRSSIVVLHDASRSDELCIAQEWRRYFRVSYQIGTPQGLAVFEGCNQLSLFREATELT